MPGLGKTTLANKVFNNQAVVDHFDVRLWCWVSQGYQIKDLLTQILKFIKPFEGAVSNIDEYELAGVLYKELKQRRYLIVMDDIWEISAWDFLRRCFPNDGNGSRILLTSRFNDLPLPNKPKIHFLNPLSDDESWELLQKKLRWSEHYPSELLEIGNRIAKGCKGVPLVVVLVAGLLADINQDQWQKVASDVTAFVMNDSERKCADLLELSYNNFPFYLKPCFLYFGCFPPDSEISCKRLIQLWIAEGFIKRTVREGLECIADSYLNDLIQRNFIHVARRRSLGGLKTCRVHGLIHDFCSSKGKEEKLVQRVINASGAASTQSCRLIILYDWGHNIKDWSSHKDVHSLLFFSYIRTESARYIFHKFKLLRVLDLMSPLLTWDIIDLPDSIGLLVHLTFLAGTFSSVPSTIGNLTNLQTFCMVCLNTDKIQLPNGFYSLVNCGICT
ncbi:hypothetical protein Leryth_009848 [Lithospermum erythrorhizon]|nr:hypothetical protein Leryth_009848 [Lithospermum erythrorhizon]